MRRPSSNAGSRRPSLADRRPSVSRLGTATLLIAAGKAEEEKAPPRPPPVLTVHRRVECNSHALQDVCACLGPRPAVKTGVYIQAARSALLQACQSCVETQQTELEFTPLAWDALLDVFQADEEVLGAVVRGESARACRCSSC